MSSLSDSSDDADHDRFFFLAFPAEIRKMIYEEYLPQMVTIGREEDPELALLYTCRQVLNEIVPILRKRSACQFILRGPQSMKLARSWIDKSGDPSKSNIRTLDIDSWIEFHRSHNSVTFRQYRFSFAFSAGRPGFTVKYTSSGDKVVLHYKYTQDSLSSRQDLPSYLEKTMIKLLGEKHDEPVGTVALNDILNAIASYSKWIHDGQTEHYEAPDMQRLEDWKNKAEQGGWVYFYPTTVIPDPQELFRFQLVLSDRIVLQRTRAGLWPVWTFRPSLNRILVGMEPTREPVHHRRKHNVSSSSPGL
ncbi:MAG: hypothetical protein Q9168_003503 [Polycauliona sp. 1 TL-2023]